MVKELQQVLTQQHLHTPYRQGMAQFQTTGHNVQRFGELASAYLGYELKGLQQIDLESGQQTEREPYSVLTPGLMSPQAI